MESIYEYNYRQQKIARIDKIIAIIAMFMISIIPLIMYRYDSMVYSPILSGNVYSTGNKVDIFNYYKSVILNISSFLILGLLIYKTIALKDLIKSNKLNMIILIFAAIILITPLVSDYIDISLLGNSDRHEGAIAWFSYLVVFYALCNIKIEKEQYKYFYWVLIPFIIVNLITSLTNLYGYNLIDNRVVNNILGKGLSGYLVTTLYHQNYGSAISAVIFSVSFTYLLLEKNTKIKIALVITTVASFTMLLAMISSGGFVTALIVLPIILVIGIRFRGIKETVLWTIPTVILNAISYMILSKSNEKVYEESFKIIEKINDISGAIIPVAIIGFILVVFIMKFINRKVVFNIAIGVVIVSMLIGGVALSNTIENNKQVITENTIYQKLNEMSTDRINIWIKTIDLINEKPILGQGLDTYPYVISDKDEDRGISTYGEFIDKPHNWYLSVAYGSGILGLSAFLAVLVYVLKGLFDKLSDKIDDKYIYIFGVGFIAYAVQGLSNDSWVGTSIIFWVLAGVCANKLFREN
ncbi:O-antigen ligase family protein [Romboutsia lituseburensis]|uniref:O-antigen ligase family protein n=1 Tax=Romboutsia lituseburensis TaxID=1537 RepID=UPI00215A1EC8|nr:O-antigen ligase family protein [Romboutsia lituseburensis]MCR8745462.1 O-antigen ligase family protein [Romboutsia lituseburensis]